MSLISITFSLGCSNNKPKNILILIDISKSNLQHIDSTLKKANEIYQLSNPSDKINIYFFSSVKYLAYSGGKLSKDREFPVLLESGYNSAKNIMVNSGTSHSIVKNIIEINNSDRVYLFTDGFFEDSDITTINNDNFKVFIIGMNISNNEKIINSFSSKDNLTISFEGSATKLQ